MQYWSVGGWALGSGHVIALHCIAELHVLQCIGDCKIAPHCEGLVSGQFKRVCLTPMHFALVHILRVGDGWVVGV